MNPDRLFRCGYCGSWRYYLSRPGRTCDLIARRDWIAARVRGTL